MNIRRRNVAILENPERMAALRESRERPYRNMPTEELSGMLTMWWNHSPMSTFEHFPLRRTRATMIRGLRAELAARGIISRPRRRV
jgi:hypothetical protein